MDAYLHLRGGQLRVTLRNLAGRRGLGITGLIFGLEMLPLTEAKSLAGVNGLIGGSLYVGPESGGMQYLGGVRPDSSWVFGSAPVTTLDLIADIQSAQLQKIEELRRAGSLSFRLDVHGTLLQSGSAEAFSGQLAYRVEAADWVAVLEQAGEGELVVGFIPKAI